jgi:hypothetical protein
MNFQELGTSHFYRAPMDEFHIILYDDPVKKMRYCSAVCLHKDQTASFFYNFKEVSRTNQETDGLVKNITIGDDSFYCKVHQRKAKTELTEVRKSCICCKSCYNKVEKDDNTVDDESSFGV